MPTADLLAELGRRCGEAPRTGGRRGPKEPAFATKAAWAKGKADKARTKLAEARAQPASGLAGQWKQDQVIAELEAEAEKFDGISASFERKGL